MENGDFKIQFRSDALTTEQLALSLKAVIPLQGIKVSLVDHEQDQGSPIAMTATDSSAQQCRLNCLPPNHKRAGYVSLFKPMTASTMAIHKPCLLFMKHCLIKKMSNSLSWFCCI